jgi:drug/metabolite transporter (DMT)-like permease
MTNEVTLKDYLKLHFVVLILGFTAILGRLTTVSTLGLVLVRTFIAVLGMGAILLYRKKRLRLPAQNTMQLLGIGGIVATHWLCFFGSARLSTVAISLVCVSTTSFFTSILEPIFQKKKISIIEVFLGLLVVVGISFIFTFEMHYTEGIIVGLLGAVVGAFFSVLNAGIAQKYDAQLVTFYQMSGAFLAALVLVPFLLVFTKTGVQQLIPSPSDWIWLIILGLLCTVYAYTQLFLLLKKISAFTLNLSINMEPVYGILLAYFIFGEKEKMTSGFYVGASFILLTVVLHPLLNSYFAKKNK